MADSYNLPDVSQEVGISEDKALEFAEAFRMFDKDSNGHITSEELATVMQALGQNPTKQEIDDLIKTADEDMNGTVEFKEFCKMMKRKADDCPDPKEDIKGAFKVFDKNGDGFIDAKELKIVMTKLGEKLSDAEVAEMIKEADVNSDGKVNYEEFTQMMCG